jgi:chaperonin GroES
MALPTLPIQAGSNLESLQRDDDIEQTQLSEQEIEAYEEALGLEGDEKVLDEEVIELDDGSVIVNYMPTEGPMKNPEFYANLAEVFDEGELDAMADEFLELIEIDRQSREERDKQYEEGLRRTGLGKDAPGGATFDGASKVVHPVMAESCVDFAAASTRELLPPDGIVKSYIRGDANHEREETAERKANFLNWQLTEQIQEYRDEMEQLLTQLPLGGSQYLKWRYDLEQKRPMTEWIPIDNMLLPYATTNFYTSARVTEVQDITEDVFQQRIDQGIYRDIGNIYTSEIEEDEMTRSQKANNKIEGKERPEKNVDGVRRVYEITCFLRLEDDDETEGKRAPYILTIDESSAKVLALYRNWSYGDEKLTKLDWYVEFKFIPWRGAYAIGLPHLIGGLSAALTGSLRALLDAAHISNSQTMLKLKGGRISGQSDRIEPTQVFEIEGAPGVDDVRKLAMPLPFNQPSNVLYNLLGWLTDAAKGVVTTAEEKIGDAGNNMPVGTAQALIEQGSKVFSSIHARLHRSQAKSLAILSRINHWYLEEMDNESGEEIEIRDFANNNDIRPVSDPNIFSETQRLAQAQAVLQLAGQFPQLYDLRQANLRVLKQLKVPNIQDILPNPDGIKESNPALENVSMSMGRPAAAYPDQDHLAHIKVHLNFAMDPNYGASPLIGPAYTPHLLEHLKQHITLHYLQSMRGYVAQAAGGEDIFKLNEERPLDKTSEQALAIACQMVQQDGNTEFQPIQPAIQQLVQKAQQAIQAQQQQAMSSDPTAQVILKTQMAETQRKQEEAQAKMQLELQKSQQEYQLKVAELQRQVEELQVKYQTQSQIDSQKNATTIALANINNAAKERVAQISAGVQMDQQQAKLEHEQNMSAMEATMAAEADIRQHGIAVEQQAFQQQAQQVQAQAQAQNQAALAEQQHQQTLMQNDQQHQQALQQQAAAPQPEPQQPTPTTGEA